MEQRPTGSAEIAHPSNETPPLSDIAPPDERENVSRCGTIATMPTELHVLRSQRDLGLPGTHVRMVLFSREIRSEERWNVIAGTIQHDADDFGLRALELFASAYEYFPPRRLGLCDDDHTVAEPADQGALRVAEEWWSIE